MSEQSIDVLMKVVGPSGAFAAESNTTFSGTAVMDPLRSGFVPGQFCELQSFEFTAGTDNALQSDADRQEEAMEKMKEKEREKERDEALKSGKPIKALGSSASGGLSYKEKMESIYKGQARERKKRGKDDEVDMQPVGFTRIMDSMSTQLFSALVGCDTLESLTIVKRRASGSGNRLNTGSCYLRLNFTKVLITELEWRDSQHVLIESGKFIYRKVEMLYRPQKPDGSLDVAVQATWEMKQASKK